MCVRVAAPERLSDKPGKHLPDVRWHRPLCGSSELLRGLRNQYRAALIFTVDVLGHAILVKRPQLPTRTLSDVDPEFTRS
jgi:hypothetical protein